MSDRAMECNDVLEGRFELRELLSDGQARQVLIASDRQLDRWVVIKTLHPGILADPSAGRLLKEGVKNGLRLTHKNIALLYDYRIAKRAPYLVLEFVDGITLDHYMYEQPDQRIDKPSFLGMACQILEALEYAHRTGIVHGALKPQNLMVMPGGHVKVLDFGIAQAIRNASARVTGSKPELSLHYSSPEQICGEELTLSTDSYAIGCIFYQMLCGYPPFCHGELWFRHLREQPEPLQDMPSELNAAILACLSKDKAKRPSIADLRSMLLLGRTILLPAASSAGQGSEPESAIAPGRTGNAASLGGQAAGAAATSENSLPAPVPARLPERLWLSLAWIGAAILILLGIFFAQIQQPTGQAPVQASGPPSTVAPASEMVQSDRPVVEQERPSVVFQQSRPVAVPVRNRQKAR